MTQRDYSALKGKIALYVHWPFCLKKCPYCDFNVHLNNREPDDVWIDAYLRAFDSYCQKLSGKKNTQILGSVFFGGGTPSLMPPLLVEKLLERACQFFMIDEDLEVTLEANPTSSEIQKFEDFKAAGVNRVSVGIQSLNDEALHFLGRQHSAADGLKAIEMAQKVFKRSSFDLIYGRPEQSLQDWEAELQQALQKAGGHLSLYELTIEEKTALYKRRNKGEFIMPDENLASDFFVQTYDMMQTHGLPAYEVSNFSAPGQECRYNVMTWLYEDYIGIGPGAHGRLHTTTETGIQKIATYENRVPARWLKSVQQEGNACEEWKILSPRDCFEEALITGLRMFEGIGIHHVEQKSGLNFQEEIRMDIYERVQREGWLLEEEGTLKLSAEGMLRYDMITRELLSRGSF